VYRAVVVLDYYYKRVMSVCLCTRSRERVIQTLSAKTKVVRGDEEDDRHQLIDVLLKKNSNDHTGMPNDWIKVKVYCL
jgi:hypothetical protein